MTEFRWLECDDREPGAVVVTTNDNRESYAKLQFRERGRWTVETLFEPVWADVPFVSRSEA